VGIYSREVQFSGDEEEDRFHGLQAGVTARFSFGSLEQSVEGCAAMFSAVEMSC
jgi:hypothetical protein